MNKLFLITSLALLVTGCAATGELDTVPARVTALEASDKALNADLKSLSKKTDVLTQDQQQCLKHCKLTSTRMNSFDQKLDNAFNKALIK